jgi:hypothetical protein
MGPNKLAHSYFHLVTLVKNSLLYWLLVNFSALARMIVMSPRHWAEQRLAERHVAELAGFSPLCPESACSGSTVVRRSTTKHEIKGSYPVASWRHRGDTKE